MHHFLHPSFKPSIFPSIPSIHLSFCPSILPQVISPSINYNSFHLSFLPSLYSSNPTSSIHLFSLPLFFYSYAIISYSITPSSPILPIILPYTQTFFSRLLHHPFHPSFHFPVFIHLSILLSITFHSSIYLTIYYSFHSSTHSFPLHSPAHAPMYPFIICLLIPSSIQIPINQFIHLSYKVNKFLYTLVLYWTLSSIETKHKLFFFSCSSCMILLQMIAPHFFL